LERPGKPSGTEIKWDTSAFSYADDVNLLVDNIDTIKKNTETFINATEEVGLEVYAQRTRYMLLPRQQNKGAKS
jgi:nitrous oxide reductase